MIVACGGWFVMMVIKREKGAKQSVQGRNAAVRWVREKRAGTRLDN